LKCSAGLIRRIAACEEEDTGEFVHVAPLQSCCDPCWEAAYRQFESPEAEVHKFRRRLRWLGAGDWPRSARIVELFCGRGNGLVALERLGFRGLEGVDLSESLLREYRGCATCYLADCRALPFPDASRDIVTVHGGFHHLSCLPEDLDRVLSEARRVLVADGLLAFVEPWRTPFLSLVHAVADRPLACRVWGKLDALAMMIRREAVTYRQWLERPETILNVVAEHFATVQTRVAWGKILFLGRKRPLAFARPVPVAPVAPHLPASPAAR